MPTSACRPVPLYLAEVGIATGRYEQLLAGALEILRQIDPNLLRAAWFEMKQLDELSFDPRAYDFNHPANKRPNYHFGMWDPHVIDQRGFYRRFVLQQTLLEALLERVEGTPELAREELLYEASVVLAGTMLMASGTSGNGPECHDSTVTLSNLLPQIAAYRDEYYRLVLAKLNGPHAERLQKETKALRQPFAGARQHLNNQLARRRALQLQHVHLAVLFARLGYAENALEQANIVPVVSARMTCRLYCLLTSGWHTAQAGQLAQATEYLPQIEQLLKRAIECGAVVDPWNILGFNAQFSLFPAMENSVPDLRVDELVDLMEQFALAARIWHLGAVSDQQELCERVAKIFRRVSEWWDQYATTSVSDVKPVSGRQAYDAAQRVAVALEAWHKAGSAAGDISFWRTHAEQFDSPQAYARVIEVLLEKHDLASSSGLLMHWLAQADTMSLEEGLFSFRELASAWLQKSIDAVRPQQLSQAGESKSAVPSVSPITAGGAPLALPPTAETAPKRQPTTSVAKFFDQLEASADSWWEAPELSSVASGKASVDDEEVEDLFQSLHDDEDEGGEDDESADDEGELYGAAYDEMVYRDSTADGVDSSLQDSGSDKSDYELEQELHRISARLGFLHGLSQLWKQTALANPLTMPGLQLTPDHLDNWLSQLRKNRRKLSQLAHAVELQPLVPLNATQEALMEYDRRRVVRETLLERIITCGVALTETELMLRSVLPLHLETTSVAEEPGHWPVTVEFWRALLRGDTAMARQVWPGFLQSIRNQPLLYVPLAKGGSPPRIAGARGLQQIAPRTVGAHASAGDAARSVPINSIASRDGNRQSPVGGRL